MGRGFRVEMGSKAAVEVLRSEGKAKDQLLKVGSEDFDFLPCYRWESLYYSHNLEMEVP